MQTYERSISASDDCWKIIFSPCCSTVFRPISADAKLRMNPRSDVDFSSPKVDLTVNLSEVAMELNRPQVGVCLCVSRDCKSCWKNDGKLSRQDK